MYRKIADMANEKGITFAELSRQTGISQNVFSNLKDRDGNMTIANAAKVAKYFGCTIEDLIIDDFVLDEKE